MLAGLVTEEKEKRLGVDIHTDVLKPNPTIYSPAKISKMTNHIRTNGNRMRSFRTIFTVDVPIVDRIVVESMTPKEPLLAIDIILIFPYP